MIQNFNIPIITIIVMSINRTITIIPIITGCWRFRWSRL